VAGIAHAQERDGAVDAAAHPDGDAPFVWSRRDGWAERVVKRVPRETLAGNGRSVEERTPLDLAEKPPDAGALSDRVFDPLPRHRQSHPGEISVPSGVSDELSRRSHSGMVP